MRAVAVKNCSLEGEGSGRRGSDDDSSSDDLRTEWLSATAVTKDAIEGNGT